MSQINIPAEQWGELIGAAVMQSLTTDNRDMLIKHAIQELLTVREGVYGAKPKTSKLQDIFDNVITFHVRDLMTKWLADPTNAAEINSLFNAAIAKALGRDEYGVTLREKITTKLADAMANGFKIGD